MTELANGEAVYSPSGWKQNLQKKYKDSLYFAEVNGRSDVVCFSNMVNYIVNDNGLNHESHIKQKRQRE